MALTWQEATLSRVEQVTDNTRLFFLKTENNVQIDFSPGQYITIDLPIADKPAKRWRSFSIASAPNKKNELELVIVLLEGGAGSNYLFNEAKIGDKLSFHGPKGIFNLPKELDRDLFLICTGTGIAPYRSMLHYIRDNNIEINHNIYLIFGTRTQKDLLYYEEMLRLEKEIPHFHYIPTLSRENWEGETGYVHPIYERLTTEKQSAYFYICGWKDMIKEARKRIKDLGYDRKAIRQELFG